MVSLYSRVLRQEATLECPKAGLCFIFGLGGHLAARELECEICKSAEKKREKEKAFLDNPKALGNNSKVFEKSDEIRASGSSTWILDALTFNRSTLIDPKSTIKCATNPKYGIIGLIYNPNLTVSLFSGCAHSLDACCGQRATATAAGTLWISLYGFPIARMIQTKHAGKREPGLPSPSVHYRELLIGTVQLTIDSKHPATNHSRRCLLLISPQKCVCRLL